MQSPDVIPAEGKSRSGYHVERSLGISSNLLDYPEENGLKR